MREYWRLDPKGSLMGRPLEGYAASGNRYGPVQAVEHEGRGIWLRSEVLELDLRSRAADGATVLVFRDPQTGTEFTGELKEAEQRLRIAERRASAAEKRAIVAERRVQALEERLRNLTARAGRNMSG